MQGYIRIFAPSRVPGHGPSMPLSTDAPSLESWNNLGVQLVRWCGRLTGSRFSPPRPAGDLERAVSSGLNVHSADNFASASAAMASRFWRARSLRVSSASGSGCRRAQLAMSVLLLTGVNPILGKGRYTEATTPTYSCPSNL